MKLRDIVLGAALSVGIVGCTTDERYIIVDPPGGIVQYYKISDLTPDMEEGIDYATPEKYGVSKEGYVILLKLRKTHINKLR